MHVDDGADASADAVATGTAMPSAAVMAPKLEQLKLQLTQACENEQETPALEHWLQFSAQHNGTLHLRVPHGQPHLVHALLERVSVDHISVHQLLQRAHHGFSRRGRVGK